MITKADVDAAHAAAQRVNPRNDPYRTGWCHSDDLRYQDAMDAWRRLKHDYEKQSAQVGSTGRAAVCAANDSHADQNRRVS